MKKETIGVAASIFIILLGIVALSWHTVDASHLGVKVRMGEITGVMQPGIKFTGPFVDVFSYSLKTRQMTVTMEGNQGAVDKSGQSIFATIDINYRLNPASVQRAYESVGVDGSLEGVLNIDPIIREGFKSVTSKYESLEIFQKRPEVKQAAIDKITENFPSEFFTLENVIVSNIDFNPSFKEAIEGAKVAEEQAKAEEQKVKIATAQANIKIATAEGDKQKVQLEADAQAYEITELAKAEAESLRLKRLQITPGLIQLEYINAWKSGGAQVPKYMMGDSASMMMMLPSDEYQQEQVQQVQSAVSAQE